MGLLSYPGNKSFLIILLVTAIEDIGLILWLNLIHASPVFIGLLTALLTLVSFLSIEHIITQFDANTDLTAKTILEIVSFSLLETINWIIWLALVPINASGAAIYFLIGFYVEHQITDNIKKGRPYLHFSTSKESIFGLSAITLSEFVGAALWIVLGPVGIIALVSGSTVEHYIAHNIPD